MNILIKLVRYRVFMLMGSLKDLGILVVGLVDVVVFVSILVSFEFGVRGFCYVLVESGEWKREVVIDFLDGIVDFVGWVIGEVVEVGVGVGGCECL